MKVSEIPRQIFGMFAVKDEISTFPDEHLGGTRTIAPFRGGFGYIVLAEHSVLNCSSCSIFEELSWAMKGLFPTCSVQVGPHPTHWVEEMGACHNKLKVSFWARNSPPPLSGLEYARISLFRERMLKLERIAEPVEFLDLAMDLVE